MAIGKICNEAENAIKKGNSILIISNRKESKFKALEENNKISFKHEQ